MGRSPFFGGSRKMRGFPLNLNPGALGGEDGPPPGFPYFGAEKFEFGYGGPVAFHHEFFGAHPPPHPHGPPFSGPGNPGESWHSWISLRFPSFDTSRFVSKSEEEEKKKKKKKEKKGTERQKSGRITREAINR